MEELVRTYSTVQLNVKSSLVFIRTTGRERAVSVMKGRPEHSRVGKYLGESHFCKDPTVSLRDAALLVQSKAARSWWEGISF